MNSSLFDEAEKTKLKSPDTFSISGRGLKLSGKEDVVEIVQVISSMDRLDNIELNGNTFGVEATRAVADCLRSKTHLKRANLSDMFTGRLKDEVSEAVKIISESLTNKPNLKELNISDNAFGPIGAESLANFLKNTPSLENFYINNNGLGIQGGTIIAESLIECYEKSTQNGPLFQLKRFVAGRNRLENGSSRILSKLFSKMTSFVEIRIPQNGIRSEGIQNLCEGLGHCKGLEVLDLQDNTFTKSASLTFAKILPNFPKLKHLNIGDCLLGPKGALAIVQSLEKVSPDLQYLNLGYNEIQENSTMILSRAVAKMKNLRFLEINGNCLNPDGAGTQQIITALEETGNEDALGSLSDMEEMESEDEEVSEVEEAIEDVQKNVSQLEANNGQDELLDTLNNLKLSA